MMGEDDHIRKKTNGRPDPDTDPLGIIGWVMADKYRIVQYVSSGGFGHVYKGRNVNLVDQVVIIKFLRRLHDAIQLEKEAQTLSKLNHSNICGIVDYLKEERALIVPFIDGENCEDIVERSGSLSTKDFLSVLRALVSALVFAHNRQIAHRDLKPANIMLDRNGHVFLIDFGIAKQIGGTMTKTGYQALTPQFAAPERHRKEKGYDPFLSDIYELGITLYYLLTGRMPFRDPAKPVYSEWGGPEAARISSPLRRLLKRATHPVPKRRHASMEELAHRANRVTRAYRRRKVSLFAGVTIVLAAALLGYTFRAELDRYWNRLVVTPSAVSTEPSATSRPPGAPDTIADVQSANVDSTPDTISDKPISRGGAVAPARQESRVVATEPNPSDKSGELLVKSIPTNATVFVDGAWAGTTTLRVHSISAEDHQIRIEKLMYLPVTKQIEITTNTIVTVNEKLTADFGKLSLQSVPRGADIYIGDEYAGTTPYVDEALPTGTHPMVLKRDNFHDVVWQLAMTPEGNIDTTIYLPQAFGSLIVSTKPDSAIVFLDDTLIGTTPLQKDTVASGTYAIRIEKELYRTLDTTVTVANSIPTVVNVPLNTDSEPPLSLATRTEPDGASQPDGFVYVRGGSFQMGGSEEEDEV